MKTKILHLTLKKKWFDMILSGEKKEEYREIKIYWIKRITNYNFLKHTYTRSYIKFKNGYAKNAPSFFIELKNIRIGKPNRKWCDKSHDKKVYIFELGEIQGSLF